MPAKARVRNVIIVVFPNCQTLDVVGPLEVLTTATRIARQQAGHDQTGYRVRLCSSQGGSITSSSGLRFDTERLAGLRGAIDTLLIAGGLGVLAARDDQALVRQLKRTVARSRRIASVCTGAFLLAAGGALADRKVTTHWAYCAKLQQAHPEIEVCPDAIYTEDRGIWSSAGVTAGIDLTLALVERDLGAELAVETARWLVVYVQRGGGQEQFSTQLAAQVPQDDRLRQIQQYIADHPEAELSVAALARRSGMSPRNFARRFRAEFGRTPGAYVEAQRVEAARRLLETTDHELTMVAELSGLGSPGNLRRVLVKQIGVAPSAYRQRFQRTA